MSKKIDKKFKEFFEGDSQYEKFLRPKKKKKYKKFEVDEISIIESANLLSKEIKTLKKKLENENLTEEQRKEIKENIKTSSDELKEVEKEYKKFKKGK